MHSIPVNHSTSGSPIRLDHVFTCLSAIGTLCILSWVLRYSHYGLDLTDESFYLIWISNPFIYDASVTQFGFVYHPLYRMLGGDLVALRQANILVTFCLSWVAVDTVMKKFVLGAPFAIVSRVVISAGLASVSMTAFAIWLTTPSYNSLNLQALLIAVVGLLHVDRAPTSSSAMGWVLLGLGGWLSFMAKPSSAVAMAVCTLLYLGLAGKLSARLVTIALPVTLTLVVASALLIDGSFIGFIHRIQAGLDLGSKLDSGHSLTDMFRMGDFQMGHQEKFLMLLATLFILVSTQLMVTRSGRRQVVGVTLVTLPFILVVLVTADQIQLHWGLGYFQNLLIGAVVLSAASLYALNFRAMAAPESVRSHVLSAAMVLSIPYVYAFGTNGNYWWVGGFASIFWLMGGLIGLGPIVRKHNSALVLFPTLFVAQALTSILVQSGIERPYRQTQPLRMNTHPIEVGRPGSRVLLSEPNAAFLSKAMNMTSAAGFKEGTPMIDMTGRSPGVLHVLKAENLGQAWTIGGYPGSLDLAVAALQRVPCEKFAVAWLLQEEKGRGRISPDLIARMGGDIQRDYQEVARWETSSGAGGHRGKYMQALLKPIRLMSDAATACERARPSGGVH